MITITDGEEVCTVYNIENNGYAIGVMTLTELSPLMSLGNLLLVPETDKDTYDRPIWGTVTLNQDAPDLKSINDLTIYSSSPLNHYINQHSGR